MFKKSTKRSSEKKVPILETKDLTISISLDGQKSFEGMNNNQKEFFNYFKLKIGENKALNLHNNLSYIFCYLYEILNPKNPKETISKLKNIQSLYGEIDKIDYYCNLWMSDCYVLLNNISKAISCYPKQTNSRASASSEDILSLKLQINRPPLAEELLSLFGPKITKPLIVDIDKIKNLLDKKIKYEYSIGNFLLENWSEKSSSNKYSIFNGSYQLCYSDKIKRYNFSLVSEVEEYVKKITRDAENAIREKKGIPKVGEGWVSETRLFYLLQEKFPELEIVQHASPDWLGRQHLDIFFPKLNLAIEYQGAQHDRPIEFFGGEEAFEVLKKRDRRKKRLCKSN